MDIKEQLKSITDARKVEVQTTTRLISAKEALEYSTEKHKKYKSELEDNIKKTIPNLIIRDAQRGNYSTTYNISTYFKDNEHIVIKVLEHTSTELKELGYDVEYKTKDYNGIYRQASLKINWNN